MTALDEIFELGGETVHAVLLRQASKVRWNAYLWGSGLRLANSFARREGAERWLTRQLQRYFPALALPLATKVGTPKRARRRRPAPLRRGPVYQPPA